MPGKQVLSDAINSLVEKKLTPEKHVEALAALDAMIQADARPISEHYLGRVFNSAFRTAVFNHKPFWEPYLNGRNVVDKDTFLEPSVLKIRTQNFQTLQKEAATQRVLLILDKVDNLQLLKAIHANVIDSLNRNSVALNLPVLQNGLIWNDLLDPAGINAIQNKVAELIFLRKVANASSPEDLLELVQKLIENNNYDVNEVSPDLLSLQNLPNDKKIKCKTALSEKFIQLSAQKAFREDEFRTLEIVLKSKLDSEIIFQEFAPLVGVTFKENNEYHLLRHNLGLRYLQHALSHIRSKDAELLEALKANTPDLIKLIVNLTDFPAIGDIVTDKNSLLLRKAILRNRVHHVAINEKILLDPYAQLPAMLKAIGIEGDAQTPFTSDNQLTAKELRTWLFEKLISKHSQLGSSAYATLTASFENLSAEKQCEILNAPLAVGHLLNQTHGSNIRFYFGDDFDPVKAKAIAEENRRLASFNRLHSAELARILADFQPKITELTAAQIATINLGLRTHYEAEAEEAKVAAAEAAAANQAAFREFIHTLVAQTNTNEPIDEKYRSLSRAFGLSTTDPLVFTHETIYETIRTQLAANFGELRSNVNANDVSPTHTLQYLKGQAGDIYHPLFDIFLSLDTTTAQKPEALKSQLLKIKEHFDAATTVKEFIDKFELKDDPLKLRLTNALNPLLFDKMKIQVKLKPLLEPINVVPVNKARERKAIQKKVTALYQIITKEEENLKAFTDSRKAIDESSAKWQTQATKADKLKVQQLIDPLGQALVLHIIEGAATDSEWNQISPLLLPSIAKIADLQQWKRIKLEIEKDASLTPQQKDSALEAGWKEILIEQMLNRRLDDQMYGYADKVNSTTEKDFKAKLGNVKTDISTLEKNLERLYAQREMLDELIDELRDNETLRDERVSILTFVENKTLLSSAIELERATTLEIRKTLDAINAQRQIQEKTVSIIAAIQKARAGKTEKKPSAAYGNWVNEQIVETTASSTSIFEQYAPNSGLSATPISTVTIVGFELEAKKELSDKQKKLTEFEYDGKLVGAISERSLGGTGKNYTNRSPRLYVIEHFPTGKKAEDAHIARCAFSMAIANKALLNAPLPTKEVPIRICYSKVDLSNLTEQEASKARNENSIREQTAKYSAAALVVNLRTMGHSDKEIESFLKIQVDGVQLKLFEFIGGLDTKMASTVIKDNLPDAQQLPDMNLEKMNKREYDKHNDLYDDPSAHDKLLDRYKEEKSINPITNQLRERLQKDREETQKKLNNQGPPASTSTEEPDRSYAAPGMSNAS